MSFSKPIKKEDLRLGGRIGVGGFSDVYKGTLNGQEVAVKQLLKPNRREVEIHESLDHPNIVKFIGELEKDSTLYLVFELCNGGTLRSHLDQKKFHDELLPPSQVYDWAIQIIKAIKHLHEQNIVHKDITTRNILIADGNILKLADLGLARFLQITTENASQSGTTVYKSPELLKDNILSPSYDIYGYGIVLWELCTTKVPFEDAENNSQIVWRICEYKERPAIPANCPKPLADLMRKCWEEDRKKRPNPDEILQLLLAAEAHEKQKFIAGPLLAAEAHEKQKFIAGPWTCAKKLGQQEPGNLVNPVGIAINPTNHDVAVVDAKLKKLVVYHSTGEFKLQFSIGHVVYLRGVAISNDGNYYITTCTQFVHCYNESGVHTSEWVAESPDNTLLDSDDTSLIALAIDHTSNLVLVGVLSPRYISMHHLNGTHANTIKVNIEPWFLSVTTHGTIIISDHAKSVTAQIVDQTGQMLHTLKPPSHQVPHWMPYGVCCHEGIIFICIDPVSSQQIECFSMHGDYLGSITLDINPYDITFVPGQKKFLVSSAVGGKLHMYSCPD